LTPPALYQAQGENLVRRIPAANGRCRSVTLANVHARIVGDILVDGGVDVSRRFLLEAAYAGQKLAFELPAAEFARMQWVLPRLGPRAIIYPGQQQHARAAIQYLSGAVPQQRILTHLGWRQDGDHWVYLHAGGVLGAAAATSSWQVRVPASLQRYRLPTAAHLDGPGCAVRASLLLLDAAVDRITIPLLAAVYRAVLGAPSFSLFVSGPSGVFKSALAAVCQQHFGAGMDAAHLPANFASTGNALEWLAFAAKDALLVVDDFAPTGGLRDAELEAVAERLFRAAGNRQGRHRLGRDGRVSDPRAPRGLVLATGEMVPAGQSLRARLLILEVGPGDVCRRTLSECQRAGQAGLLAGAMAAFVKWMAARYPEMQACHRQRVAQLRDQKTPDGRHARAPAAVAELQSGWEIFLRFAAEGRFITAGERDALVRRGALALAELQERQAVYQHPSDAALRFLALLQGALAGGT
jgi:hypothetical protein